MNAERRMAFKSSCLKAGGNFIFLESTARSFARQWAENLPSVELRSGLSQYFDGCDSFNNLGLIDP